MDQKMSRDRVNGYLSVEGNKIVNGAGEEILLTGWGLGNWLLTEGYMWKAHSPRFDRPRRMEAAVQELTGKEYADSFWIKFRENYITEKDISQMAEMGYNSVRIPFNSRLFLEEGEGFVWKEEGFRLLDQCIDWCEKHRIYAFLDMHAAPGGQTGANIDDCIDDIPRLFIDDDCFEKGIALWARLAERYAGRYIVGGYDLLNEPIRPRTKEDSCDYDRLLPKLAEFYDKAIEAVRKVDTKHLFSIEGHHWATNTAVFYKKYDPQMVLHFHRYACHPEPSVFTEFIEAGNRLHCPLWLGESGENKLEWYTAMFPLCAALGIGYNLWPWKKMDCSNSPCSVRRPHGWDQILDYINRGRHPGYREARAAFDSYLENMKLSNCDIQEPVQDYVFRRPGCSIRATDFDGTGLKGSTCSARRTEQNIFGYRLGSGMKIVELDAPQTRLFAFDSQWDRFALELEAGEYASYTLNDIREGSTLGLELYAPAGSQAVLYQGDVLLAALTIPESHAVQELAGIKLLEAGTAVIQIKVTKGFIHLIRLTTAKQPTL